MGPDAIIVKSHVSQQSIHQNCNTKNGNDRSLGCPIIYTETIHNAIFFIDI